MTTRVGKWLRTAALLGVAAGPSQLAAQAPDSTYLAGIKQVKGTYVMQCAAGDFVVFSHDDVERVEGTSLVFKNRAFVLHATTTQSLDAAQQDALARYLIHRDEHLGAGVSGAITLDYSGAVFKRNHENCAVKSLVSGPREKGKWEVPIVARRMDVWGKPVVEVVYDYPKPRSKDKSTVCVITKPAIGFGGAALAPELEAAFYDQLVNSLRKGGQTVVFAGEGTPPAGGHELKIDFVGQTTSGPTYLYLDVIVRSLDRATGGTIFEARGGRLIGKKQDSDVRSVADMIGC